MNILDELKQMVTTNTLVKGIGRQYHPELPLSILNYHQFESIPYKFDPLVCLCRGLVVHDDGHIIAKGFNRFFNVGEIGGNIQEGQLWEKVDGSFMLMYHFDKWRVNTRNSWANGETNGKTWSELFWPHVKNLNIPHYSYVFELVGPYNKVVKAYPPCLFLLAVFDGMNELPDNEVDDLAKFMGVPRPKRFDFGLNEAQKYLDNLEDKTFEGFIIKNGPDRWKLKSKTYLALHKLKNNGAVANPKGFLEFYKTGEEAELMATFPEYKDTFENYMSVISYIEDEVNIIVKSHTDLTDKEFALKFNKHRLASFLYLVRRGGSIRQGPLLYFLERK